MPKKSQLGGSTEESTSTKPRKSTTKRTKRMLIEDNASLLAGGLWSDSKEETFNDTILSKDLSAGIRASNPRSPEDRVWWDQQGPAMVADWIRFREHSGWKIWTTPNGEPAVEIEMSVPVGNTFIKMAIDRVMINAEGELCIVDLKTGRRVPQSGLQLGFYKYGIQKTYGIEINTGYYWMARNAVMSDPVDISKYTEEKIEYLVSAFDAARKAHSFLPNTSNCNMCGYTIHCAWYKGEK